MVTLGKSLYRYLVVEQVVPTSVCFLGLILILIIGQLARLTRFLFMSSITGWDVLQLIGYALPKLALYALPMATLIGVLIAFGRLNNDNELIALRCAGIGFQHFWPPVATVVVLTTLVSFFISIYLMPVSNHAFRKKLGTMGKAVIPMLLREGTFIDTLPGMIFFFNHVDPAHFSIDGVFIQDSREKNVKVSIVAKRARIINLSDQNKIVMKILDGVITRVESRKNNAQTIFFKEYEIGFPLDALLQNPKKHSRKRGEMTLAELYQNYRKSKNLKLALEFHQRLALPLACFLLGGIAAPLGTLFQKGSQIMSVVLGIGIFLLYYILLSAGKGLGENGLIPPSVAIWTPNVLCFAFLVYLWAKSHWETTPQFFWHRQKNLKPGKNTQHS